MVVLICLARRDIKTNRRWVIVLEICQASIAACLKFKTDGLSSWTIKGGNAVAISGSYSGDTIVRGNTGHGFGRSRGRGNAG